MSRYRLLVVALATALVLVPTAVFASHTFGDVPDSDWAHDDIAWLKEKQLTNGCGDGTIYCPDDGLTRRQIAAFTHREQQLLGTRYDERFDTGIALPDAAPTLLLTGLIDVPNNGGALSIYGTAVIAEDSTTVDGILWVEFDSDGNCGLNNLATFAAPWGTGPLGGVVHADIGGGGGVTIGSYFVDLCAIGTGGSSTVDAELEVTWIASGYDGEDFGSAGAVGQQDRGNLTELRSRWLGG